MINYNNNTNYTDNTTNYINTNIQTGGDAFFGSTQVTYRFVSNISLDNINIVHLHININIIITIFSYVSIMTLIMLTTFSYMVN